MSLNEFNNILKSYQALGVSISNDVADAALSARRVRGMHFRGRESYLSSNLDLGIHIERNYEQVEQIINAIRNGIPSFQLPRITFQRFEPTESPDFNDIVEDVNAIRYDVF